MSTKIKTENLKLPQYQNDDLFDMKEVNEAYKIIDESYKEQNDNYKQAIETSTINGAIDNLELIDARKGKRTLGEKISEIDEQLETKVTKLSNVVYLEHDNNFIGDGVADDSKVIQNIINNLESIGGGKIIFPYKKNIKISKQGTRAIKTWHSGQYSRMYSLLIPSNVEIDFNYCTLNVMPDNDTKGMVMAFENKNADNNSKGDNDIILRNLIIDCNMEYEGNYNTSTMGDYDRHGLSLNNIDGLILENITILNTMGYGLYLCNARNFKIKGDLIIKNNMGCSCRIGWGDETKNGDVDNIIIINNSPKYESWLATNSLYVIASDLDLKLIKTYYDDFGLSKISNNTIANKLSSSNFANGCNNININRYESDGMGIKIQNYTNTLETAPKNFNFNKVNIHNSFINIQGKACYINELNLTSDSFINQAIDNFYVFNIWDCDSLNINKLFMKNVGLFFKSDYKLLGDVSLNQIKMINSSIGNTTNTGAISINKLISIRNQNQNTSLNNTTKYILAYNGPINIGEVKIINDDNCDTKTSFINIGKGSTIKTVLGNLNGLEYVNSTIFTLSSGTSTILKLNALDINKLVYKANNNMFYSYELIPINASARNIIFSNKTFTNYFERIALTHNQADGTEQFYLRITKFIVGEPISW